MSVSLRPIDPAEEWVVRFLYELLRSREPGVSISHKEMPTWEEHCAFVHSRQYAAWYLIQTFSNGDTYPIGACYLTFRDEIGIHIEAGQTGKGYGGDAVSELMRRHPRQRYLANIAPTNERSLEFFGKLGFHLVQNTMEKLCP